jgi:hypothetical protein
LCSSPRSASNVVGNLGLHAAAITRRRHVQQLNIIGALATFTARRRQRALEAAIVSTTGSLYQISCGHTDNVAAVALYQSPGSASRARAGALRSGGTSMRS